MPTFAATLLFAAAVATALRISWNPGLQSYVEYVPISGLFAAFVLERIVVYDRRLGLTTVVCDVLVIVLALMRVLVPPLPFVSGHSLFSAYAFTTPCRWHLRAVALVVLAQVAYVKLVLTGGMVSMVLGFAAAALLAFVRHAAEKSVVAELDSAG
ncbi:MAG: hypothetical protein SF187_29850 [Deltaproteobacteria bacterium]|nr:hypothetical protein [Deltaproteobacteria bacterium]